MNRRLGFDDYAGEPDPVHRRHPGLNGVSSSGKSSLARQLLVDLERPYFHMGVDMISAMRSESRTHELDRTALSGVLRRTRAGFHRAVAAMASAGNDVNMDHILSEPWRLRDCLTVMTGIDVVFVGVHCSFDELHRREQQRGDRPPGTAAAQRSSVHAHGTYDLEVDTSADTVAACSARIAIRRCSTQPDTELSTEPLEAQSVCDPFGLRSTGPPLR